MTERSATPPSAATARLVQVRHRVRRIKRRRVLSVAGGALMVAAIVVATAMLAPSAAAPPPAASAAPSLTAPDLIIVPNVVGLTVAAAEQQLTAAHLAWSIVEVDVPPPPEWWSRPRYPSTARFSCASPRETSARYLNWCG